MVILQNWFARYPTAEVLTQAYVFAGLYALSRVLGQHKPQRSWGLLAGLWLGYALVGAIGVVGFVVTYSFPLTGLLVAHEGHQSGHDGYGTGQGGAGRP